MYILSSFFITYVSRNWSLVVVEPHAPPTNSMPPTQMLANNSLVPGTWCVPVHCNAFTSALRGTRYTDVLGYQPTDCPLRLMMCRILGP